MGADEEYEGDWENGLSHGAGILRTGGVEYRGEFFEGKKVIFIFIIEWNWSDF